MKLHLFVSTFLLLSATFINAQEQDRSTTGNSMQIQFLGESAFVALQFEYMFNERLGGKLGLSPFLTSFAASYHIPVSREYSFELGVGAIYSFSNPEFSKYPYQAQTAYPFITISARRHISDQLFIHLILPLVYDQYDKRVHTFGSRLDAYGRRSILNSLGIGFGILL